MVLKISRLIQMCNEKLQKILIQGNSINKCICYPLNYYILHTYLWHFFRQCYFLYHFFSISNIFLLNFLVHSTSKFFLQCSLFTFELMYIYLKYENMNKMYKIRMYVLILSHLKKVFCICLVLVKCLHNKNNT